MSTSTPVTPQSQAVIAAQYLFDAALATFNARVIQGQPHAIKQAREELHGHLDHLLDARHQQLHALINGGT
ncbi:hypothetical protein [Thalassobaculum litoreum]|uniref:Uncharacterized protein n=1 Tax=Thalassobaculum litoreum DSM 18839 TaxID=1123362 RepID=A0A8G2BKM2_9PROT|nr:hypothetical protein [Thalassobaculum litoreum]SDF83264.1 hypothetical protein SAMN05660686_02459 [Thalassobaculum litoreum DSM 18839]